MINNSGQCKDNCFSFVDRHGERGSAHCHHMAKAGQDGYCCLIIGDSGVTGVAASEQDRWQWHEQGGSLL